MVYNKVTLSSTALCKQHSRKVDGTTFLQNSYLQQKAGQNSKNGDLYGKTLGRMRKITQC
jgi:hypothetical protein